MKTERDPNGFPSEWGHLYGIVVKYEERNLWGVVAYVDDPTKYAIIDALAVMHMANAVAFTEQFLKEHKSDGVLKFMNFHSTCVHSTNHTYVVEVGQEVELHLNQHGKLVSVYSHSFAQAVRDYWIRQKKVPAP